MKNGASSGGSIGSDDTTNGANEPPKRIASLLASGTELVCALGLGERLVARSHECDFPAWVKRLPAVSRPTFDIGGTSADIDAPRARAAARRRAAVRGRRRRCWRRWPPTSS